MTEKDQVSPQFGAPKPGVEYSPRPGAYGVVQDTAGRVAVLSTGRGFYLPGGGSEMGETPEETLTREVFEECGFEICIGAKLGFAIEYVHSPGHAIGIRKECTSYNATVIDDRPPVTEPDEELLWLTTDQALTGLVHGCERWAVTRLAE